MRYRVYETCIAEFSAIVEADSPEDAKRKFNESNPDLHLEEISERLDGTELITRRLKEKKLKKKA